MLRFKQMVYYNGHVAQMLWSIPNRSSNFYGCRFIDKINYTLIK